MDRPSYLLVTPEYPEAAPIFRLCNIDLEGGRAAGIVTTEGACELRQQLLAAGAWASDLVRLAFTVPEPLKRQALAVKPRRMREPLATFAGTAARLPGPDMSS